MRKLFDTIETQVRSLNCLGYDCHSYGPMLIPILLSKLPQDVNLNISRKFSKNVWDIKLIIDTLRLEIEAREKIVSIGDSNSYSGKSFSGAALFVEKRSVKPACVFCNKTNHSSHKCRTVSKPQARKDIVMQKKLCFLCLKPNHSAKNCEKNFTCFKCNGKHHVGICTYTPKESGKTNGSKSDKNDKKVDSDDDKKKIEDKTKKDDKNVLNAGIATKLSAFRNNSSTCKNT